MHKRQYMGGTTPKRLDSPVLVLYVSSTKERYSLIYPWLAVVVTRLFRVALSAAACVRTLRRGSGSKKTKAFTTDRCFPPSDFQKPHEV